MLTVAYLMLQLFDTGETLRYRPVRSLHIMVFYGTVHYLLQPCSVLQLSTTQYNSVQLSTTQYFTPHADGVFSFGKYQNHVL
jgi:hypothetical protein